MKSLFTNKEISWLSFNERVLQEAADPEMPLIERLKFLGIFSSNLDEFFRVRVATLKRLVKLGKKAKKLIGHDPKNILKEIQKIVLTQQQTFEEIYQKILQEFADEKIFIINEQQLNKEQADYVKTYFQQEVRPKLFPIMIDQVDHFPDLRDHFIYLAVSLHKNNNQNKTTYALIEIPTDVLPRFLILPQIDGNNYIILLDDVIRYGLNDVFRALDYSQIEAYTIKLTRDSELDIEDDVTESYIKKVSKGLKQRQEGNPVRFVYDATIPPSLLKIFITGLNLHQEGTLIPGGRYHNFKDFMKFPDFGIKHLRYPASPKMPHRDIDPEVSLMATLEKKDILLHLSYQSFNYVIDLLREAAIEPQVVSVKMTIYRVAKNSNVMNALINAAKNGKSVMVVVELQARFDEEANIYWANRLRDEGIKVIFGVPGLKVHSKLCLITRRKNDLLKHYAMIGTGNFNEETAKIYSDHCLFTTDKRLTKEVCKVFDFFEHNYRTTNFKHLLVSPFSMRRRLLHLIQMEIKNAAKGKEAYIIMKMNNLVDTEIIEQLYAASQAGVKIRLIVRSMFAPVPGVSGLSDNIEAISIVDKYLEHSRIFIFCNGGDAKYFITSADLMPRNLDRRVEVTCPIYDKEIQQELHQFLEIQWQDNVKARILNDKLNNQFRQGPTDEKIRAQFAIHDFLNHRLTPSSTGSV